MRVNRCHVCDSAIFLEKLPARARCVKIDQESQYRRPGTIFYGDTGFVATQSYSYDSLNRLKDATENVIPVGGSATQSWKQTFVYDRYGNRRFDFTGGNTTAHEVYAHAYLQQQGKPWKDDDGGSVTTRTKEVEERTRKLYQP